MNVGRVDKNDVKPISTNIHTLNIKKTSAWNKASEELSRYQELHNKCKEGNPDFLCNYYGDPFNGQKVSQLTGSYGVTEYKGYRVQWLF